MVAAGWQLCGGGNPPISQYQVQQGLLTLYNDGITGGAVCRTDIPTGVLDWTVQTRVSWVGNYVGSLGLSFSTASHNYLWQADGYNGQWDLQRDGQFNPPSLAVPGYVPQLNTWHILTATMSHGALSLFFDGTTILTSTENGNSQLILFGAFGQWNTNNAFTNISATGSISREESFVSDTTWQVFDADPSLGPVNSLGNAQLVCLNAYAPSPCPPGATLYGWSPGGWTADLSSISGAHWIWAQNITGQTSPAEYNKYYFSKTIQLDQEPVSSSISIASDDLAEVHVNGQSVGSIGSITIFSIAAAAQHALTTFDLSPFLKQGANLITVSGENGPFGQCCPSSYSGNPAGVVFGGSIILPSQLDLSVTKFYSDDNLNPLLTDQNGNPVIDVTVASGVVQSTNPAEILAWVNITSNGPSFQSLTLNDTLPVDWAITPPWTLANGGIHLFYANTTSLATNPDITQPSTFTVSTNNPETINLAIPSLNATGIGHPLQAGESILLCTKLSYGLIGNVESSTSYPRTYVNSANATAWTQPSYAETPVIATGTASFIAHDHVVGDVNGDGKVDIVDLSLVGGSFGAQPGNGNWNGAADTNHDGTIDIIDLVTVAGYFVS